MTTANFPDVMYEKKHHYRNLDLKNYYAPFCFSFERMPAYDLNGFFSIFFIVFMLINLYIFINIILATIYTNYKKHLKVSRVDLSNYFLRQERFMLYFCVSIRMKSNLQFYSNVLNCAKLLIYSNHRRTVALHMIHFRNS